MRKLFSVVIFLCISFLLKAQKTEEIEALLKKYFIVLPGEKKAEDWIDEIYKMPNVSIDSLQKTDSAHNYLLKGRLHNTTTFANVDSVKFIVGKEYFRHRTLLNDHLLNEKNYSFFYLRHVFYFPLEKTDEKQWKELYKTALKEFRQYFVATRPGLRKPSYYDTYDLVWFSTNRINSPWADVKMEYGKSIKRSIYFIVLTLKLTTETAE